MEFKLEDENDALREKVQTFYIGVTFWDFKNAPSEYQGKCGNCVWICFVPEGVHHSQWLPVDLSLDRGFRRHTVDRGLLYCG